MIVRFEDSGPNVDTIGFRGITTDDAAGLFSHATGDFDNDGAADDALISWEGATDDADGSITIHDATWEDLAAFIADERTMFQDGLDALVAARRRHAAPGARRRPRAGARRRPVQRLPRTSFS